MTGDAVLVQSKGRGGGCSSSGFLGRMLGDSWDILKLVLGKLFKMAVVVGVKSLLVLENGSSSGG